MSRTFKIQRDYYSTGYKLYNKSTCTIEEGITVLVGCNGSGKTTLLNFIKQKLGNDKIPYIYYDNLNEGSSHSLNKALFHGNMDFVIRNAFASEGERIHDNIGEYVAAKCGKTIHDMSNDLSIKNKELWILLDAIDSGLSIDKIIEVKDILFNLILDDAKRNNISIYIIAVANEYEMAKDQMCLDIYNMKYIKFKDYEDYRNFVIKSAKIKEKRYN